MFTQEIKTKNMNELRNCLKEYRLMYMFGAWITRDIVIAEDDAEAIFDATDLFNESKLQNWQHGVALWQGNRLVHRFI